MSSEFKFHLDFFLLPFFQNKECGRREEEEIFKVKQHQTQERTIQFSLGKTNLKEKKKL